MAAPADRRKLKAQVKRQLKRMDDAERNRPGTMAQTAALGVLGLLMVIPVVVGAYLGHWVDRTWGDSDGRWTLGLILTGVVVGAVNVYLYLRE